MSVRSTPYEHVEAGRDAERAGHLLEARHHYEAALHSLRSEDADLAAKLLRWIAWTHTTEGDPNAAFDCLDAAEAVAAAIHDDMALASVFNTRAGTYFTIGDLDRAEELFGRVRALSVQVGDRKLEAIAEQNLGNVASIRGDDAEALTHFQASLVIFEGLGEMTYVGPLLNNIGRLQTDLSDDASAAITLARAREMCLVHQDRHHFIIVEVNRARVLLRGGDVVAALRIAEEAREAARECGDDRWSGEILLVCGAAHLRMGSADLGLDLLDRAADIARTREDPKLMADIVLEQARGLRTVGRNRDTLRRLNEARELFARLKARRDLASVSERLGELESAFVQIVREWGESIESKDAYTQGHCSRVADYACLLAEAAGVPDHEMMWFRMGALLHDVGKVSVPLEVLTKPGRLDDSEWQVMARHPVFGVELLDGIEFPWDVRPMIRHHHERYDGTGYPDKIGGTDIPLEARILTIADIYDALTTTRSYRPAFTHEKAMEIMASEVGRTVDPHLFALFTKVVVVEAHAAPVTVEPVAEQRAKQPRRRTVRRTRQDRRTTPERVPSEVRLGA